MSKRKVTFSHAFKTIIWPRRKLVLIGLGLIIVRSLSGLVLPASTRYILDDVIGNGDMETLKLILLAVSASLAVNAVTSFWLTQLLSVEAQHLISVLRSDVQKKILQLPTRFFDNTQTGALVSRIMNDVEGVRNLVGTGLVQLVGGVLTSAICLVLLIKISLTMTLFVLIPVAIFGVISMQAFKKIRPIFRERGAISAEVTGRLNQTLSGIRVIKGFNAEKVEAGIFEKGV
ncbi:MAG: ABC transporter transmembrane domain-containing protein, partial [Bacteroidota bacterium]